MKPLVNLMHKFSMIIKYKTVQSMISNCIGLPLGGIHMPYALSCKWIFGQLQVNPNAPTVTDWTLRYKLLLFLEYIVDLTDLTFSKFLETSVGCHSLNVLMKRDLNSKGAGKRKLKLKITIRDHKVKNCWRH